MSPRRSARVFLATFFSSFRATPFSYADPEFRFAPLWAEFYHAFGVSHGRQMPPSPTLTPTTDADTPQTDTDHQAIATDHADTPIRRHAETSPLPTHFLLFKGTRRGVSSACASSGYLIVEGQITRQGWRLSLSVI
jgi:hypothetical protein